MCTRADCKRHVGKWVQFRTPWGVHQGIIERVTDRSAIVLSPRQCIPVHLVSDDVTSDEMKRLDAALAYGGYGPGAAGGFGYPGYYGYWARWAVSFLVIYALWGLFFW